MALQMDEQTYWLELVLGYCRCELGLPRSQCCCCKLLLLFSQRQIPSGWGLQVFLQSPQGKIRAMIHRETNNRGPGSGCPPRCYLLTGEDGVLRENISLWCCTGLGLGKWHRSVVASFTLFFISFIVESITDALFSSIDFF